MRSLPLVALVVAGLSFALAACSSEPEKKPTPASKALLELKLAPPPRTITIDQDGAISDVLSGTTSARAAGKLKPEDLKTLKEIAASVEWAKIPAEGFKTESGKPVEGGRTYALTYAGLSPARTVQSMDGAAEVASFTKLRDTIELEANKIGR